MKGKRFLSLLACAALVFTLLPVLPAMAASNTDTYTFDVSEGSITITSGTTTSNHVTVSGGTDTNPVNMTINSLSITSAACAFELQGSSVVSLTLTGTNTLTSGALYAGLATFVIEALKGEKVRQTENHLKSYGQFNNPDDFVFTDEMGKHLVQRTVVKHFKKIAAEIGLPNARFHDFRHTYATTSLKNGDSIKDIQANLGHSSATITLDLYAHVTEEMKQASADRMDAFIKNIKQA